VRSWFVLPLLLLVALVGVAAFVLLRGGPRETLSEGRIGRDAPTFALSRLGGGELVTSDEMAGRAHVVNLFASWCVPCRAEHPLLMALEQRGVPVLGVAYKDEPDDAAAFLNELGNPFAIVALDPDGRFALDLGTAGVPETFVISADGRILAVHRGPLTEEIIAAEIMPALSAR
jgi:cytochrome c biogenesis protein CcmG, thiol:disulfide interchange protein DsbE